MRRLMDVCSEVQGRLRTAVKGISFRRAGILASAGIVCLVSQAIAQDKTRPERKQDAEVKSTHSTAAGETVIPECLEKLKLSEEQQTKAKEIIGSYDQKLEAVWKQFSVKYMATIRTECLLSRPEGLQLRCFVEMTATADGV